MIIVSLYQPIVNYRYLSRRGRFTSRGPLRGGGHGGGSGVVRVVRIVGIVGVIRVVWVVRMRPVNSLGSFGFPSFRIFFMLKI